MTFVQERNLLYIVEVELALATALKTEGGVHSAGCASLSHANAR